MHEVIDRDDARQPVMIAYVVDVALEVRDALFESSEILDLQLLDLGTAVELQRTHGGHYHDHVRPQAGLAALDVDEFFGAEIRAESGFGNHIVSELQRGSRRDHRVAAVRDVGERAAVDQRRIVLQRLHQVRLDRISQQRRHRTLRLELAGDDRLLVARVADHDATDSLLQIGEVVGQAQDRHDLGGDDDVEAILPRIAVGRDRQARP